MNAILTAVAALGQVVAAANVPPKIGYMYPPGAQAGTTVEVQLGALDWTPDMQLFVDDERVKLEITGPMSEQVLAPRRVGHDGGSGGVERSLGGQDLHVERRHGARGVAEADPQPARLQAVER